MRTSIIILSLALLFISSNGCKNSEARQLQKDSATSMPEPLSLDPTDHLTLIGWWSNNTQLLQLRNDGGYTLFSQMSRYSRPLERGRWGQLSYAVLRLEPYNTADATPARVGITKTDGKVTLHIRDYRPFTAIDKPPATSEDALLGEWIGAGGTLILRGNLRYTLILPRSARKSPAQIGGHSGSWTVVGKSITLQPDSPGVKQLAITVDGPQDRTVLRSELGTMQQHVQPPAATTQPH